MGFISDFKKRNETDEFGRSLGEQMLRRLPADQLSNEKKRNAEVEIALGHAQGFQRKNQLGYFGKSRLVNSLQWTLIDKGYSPEIARAIGFEIAKRIAAPKAKAP